MARVVTFTADLLFGSRVQGSLAAAGDDVQLVTDRESLREAVQGGSDSVPEVLVVDLTDAALRGADEVRALGDAGALSRTRTLGFYSHVEAEARERAQRAGFDLVVPRSRMAREGAELVARLAAGDATPESQKG
jgi:DNA-binding NarL/FixJ family response regulator